MKQKYDDPTTDLSPEERAQEDAIRKLWQANVSGREPAENTLKAIKAVIREKVPTQTSSTKPSLFVLASRVKPLLALAASVLFVFGAIWYASQRSAQHPNNTYVAENTSAISQELLALDAIIWDVMAEWEQNTLSDDYLLASTSLE